MKTMVFISYSRKDHKWKQQVVTHLRVLENQGMLDVWDDTQITAGNEWCLEIEHALETAAIALLLISANSLTSEFVLQREIPLLLERRSNEGLRIMPIILEPCAWRSVAWLRKMEVRPKGARPLSEGTLHHRQEALADIAGEIKEIIDKRAEPSSGLDSVQDTVAIAKAGLTSLTRLAPRVRAIERVRALFQLVHGQIILLSDYKDIHDALHHLQYLYAIVAESARFVSDDAWRDNLIEHELTLQEIADELASIARRGNVVAFELTWSSQIEQARRDINRAIEERDALGMRKAVAVLHRILDIEPPRVNDRLIAVARGLSLDLLVSELRQVAEPVRTERYAQEYEELEVSSILRAGL